jgi:hypothetical protein
MKLPKNIKEVTLAIGVILIALRLFIPVKEYQLYDGEGNLIRFSALKDEWKFNYQKSVIVSKTIFQAVGVVIIAGGIILISEFQKKKNIP